MSLHDGLNRRSFLRNVGMTAVAGAAAGPGASVLTAASGALGAGVEPTNGKYDFDTPYNRFGTDSTKYDQQIRIYGKDSVQVFRDAAHIRRRPPPSCGQVFGKARSTLCSWQSSKPKSVIKTSSTS